MLPFSREEFLTNFGTYNLSIWPAQLIAYLAALLLLYGLIAGGRFSDRVISSILAFMWVWTGIAYHWLSFAKINEVASVFAGFFVIEACLLLYAGFANRLRFEFKTSTTGILGSFLIFYSMLIYPALGLFVGEGYPRTPTFGVTPCPITLFLFGALLLTREPVPLYVLAIPLLWSLIGGSAAFLLDMPQDWILLFSGVIATAAIVLRDKNWRTQRTLPDIT